MPDCAQGASLHKDLPLAEVLEIFNDAAGSARALVQQLRIPMPAELLPEWANDAGLAMQRMSDAYELIAEKVADLHVEERPRCR